MQRKILIPQNFRLSLITEAETEFTMWRLTSKINCKTVKWDLKSSCEIPQSKWVFFCLSNNNEWKKNFSLHQVTEAETEFNMLIRGCQMLYIIHIIIEILSNKFCRNTYVVWHIVCFGLQVEKQGKSHIVKDYNPVLARILIPSAFWKLLSTQQWVNGPGLCPMSQYMDVRGTFFFWGGGVQCQVPLACSTWLKMKYLHWKDIWGIQSCQRDHNLCMTDLFLAGHFNWNMYTIIGFSPRTCWLWYHLVSSDRVPTLGPWSYSAPSCRHSCRRKMTSTTCDQCTFLQPWPISVLWLRGMHL